MKKEYPSWNKTVNDVLKHHNVDQNVGLSSKQVEARREKHGYNELEKASKASMWSLILEQFDDTLVKVCLLAFNFSTDRCRLSLSLPVLSTLPSISH